MNKSEFINKLRAAVNTFTDGVQDDEGAWTVKGFIDTHRDIYTISTDTKVVSKIVELYIFPKICKFANDNHTWHCPAVEARFVSDLYRA